ncbi:MAG: GlsB/YeaQ/YmgE family stress response membrane protein [Chloroflexi bacterium]|nr:GlsB/YeaQ/YmgE family stress response membrane protein [Chloroflexota bacterium]
MSILAWIVVGLIAGWLADLVVHAKGGLVMNLILGIVGAVVGGFLASAIFGGDFTTGINLTTILVAFVGAIVVVLAVRALPGRSPV